jgi:hypothetical protein
VLARSRFALTLWLATRIGIVGVAGLSVFLWPYVHGAHGPIPAALSLVDGLCAWDCRAYAQIAAHGYDRPIVANFWPMLPLYARPLVWLHVPPLAAVVLVANGASLVAYLAVYHVFERLDGEAAARWGLALFAAYPFAFFFGVGYTEPLMVAAGAGALWLALAGRRLSAGVALAAGILSRAPATLGWLGLAAVELTDGPRGLRAGWRARLGLVIPIVVLALWPLYTWIHFGDPLLWMRVRALWGWHANLSVPAGLLRWRESRMLLVYPVFALLPAAGVIGLCRARRHWPLAAIALPSFALFCVMGAFGFGRYTASVWPAFLPLGVWLSRRPSLQLPVVLALALFQGLFLQLFAHAYELQ